MKWTKHIIIKGGYPIRVYVNQNQTKGWIFPLFGKYHGILSDGDVLSLAVLLSCRQSPTPNVVTTRNHSGLGDVTDLIQIDNAA